MNYNIFEGDFGSPGDRILSHKIIKSNGKNKCTNCGNIIEKGEENLVKNAVFYGEGFMSYRLCESCCDKILNEDEY